MKAKTRVFYPNGLHRNELMRVRIVGRRALNALREKIYPIERNYFRGAKSALRGTKLFTMAVNHNRFT